MFEPEHTPLVDEDPVLRERQRAVDRLRRHAEAWTRADRGGRWRLRGADLRAAQVLLARADAAAERGEPAGPEAELGPPERALVEASAAARRRSRWLACVGLAALSVAVVLVAVAGRGPRPGEPAVVGDREPPPVAEGEVVESLTPAARPPAGDPRPAQSLEHRVIPSETLEEVALRYGVPIRALSRWNGIGEGEALTPGQTLRVTTRKLPPPLPYQMIVYRPEGPESWSSLALRFDVPVAKLRAYNPELDGEPDRGDELTIYIDPKPLVRRAEVELPEFAVRPDAISVGSPRDGRLIDGIQFPAEDALYKRRKPYIMWASSYMAEHLREAIAAFRYTYEFEGELVVADMSKKGGGEFPPHKSHQAGRDVDIWLPSLKGVYQRNRLERDIRPNPDEADWYALYGFLQALQATGAVQQVFLAYELHERVYEAATRMGASAEELDAMIAYPRGKHYRKSLLQHSDGHTHHIHVRFKCGPHDQCSAGADAEAGD